MSRQEAGTIQEVIQLIQIGHRWEPAFLSKVRGSLFSRGPSSDTLVSWKCICRSWSLQNGSLKNVRKCTHLRKSSCTLSDAQALVWRGPSQRTASHLLKPVTPLRLSSLSAEYHASYLTTKIKAIKKEFSQAPSTLSTHLPTGFAFHPVTRGKLSVPPSKVTPPTKDTSHLLSSS